MLTDKRMLSPTRWHSLGLLLGLAILLLGAGLGLRDPWPADEPRFALIAKEMIESGQWLFPFRGGELYPDKPPLFMWAIALGYALLGNLKIAFLLPSALAAVGSLTLTYWLGRRLWGQEQGFLAGLILLFTVQFTLQGKTAQIDALVAFFIALGLYGFLRFLLWDPKWRWYYLGWFAAGLGIITKGVGLLALFVLIPALYTHWPKIKAAPKLSWLKAALGPVALVAAMSLWLGPMMLGVASSGEDALIAYRDNILLRQTVTRYAKSWHHVKPFWYFIVNVIPVMWLPFSLCLPWLVVRWKGAVQAKDHRVILLLGYVVLVVLFFSLSPGKRGVYLTPALPAMALLIAPWLKGILKLSWPNRLFRGVVIVIATAGLIAGCAIGWFPHLAKQAAEISGALALLLLALGTGCALIAWLCRQAPLTGVLATLGYGWLLYSLVLGPVLNDTRTPRDIMQQLATITAKDEVLIVGFKEQHLLFAQQPLWHYSFALGGAEQTQASTAWINAQPKRWVIGSEALLSSCYDLTQGQALGYRHRTHWVVVPARAATGQCSTNGTTPLFHYTPTRLL